MVAAAAYDAISGFYKRDWVTPASDNGVTHTIDAPATDSAPNTTNAGQVTVIVDNSATTSSTVHVGDLDGFGTNQGKTWTETVTATVRDASHNPLDGATVDGTWSGGYSGTASCMTSGGQCQVTSGSIRKKTPNVTFMVNTITHNPLTHDSAANHDPDGDSTGASITVSKP